jgi:uncharacterized protein YutE (UPF0331/DUF86 family)
MNDVIVNKTGSIQRCIKRAKEELENAGDNFHEDYTRQDAAALNLTRACEQAIDLANFVIRKRKLGIPAASGESFSLLAAASILPGDLAERLVKMTGFRNIAVHEYRQLDVDIVVSIIRKDTDDLIRFTEIMLDLG